MFNELDEFKQELGIDTYSISETTLEEVAKFPTVSSRSVAWLRWSWVEMGHPHTAEAHD